MNTDLLFRFFAAILVGAVIGLEREYQHDEKIPSKTIREKNMGVRSYALISLLGGLCGFFAPISGILAAVLAATAGVLILSYYVLSSHNTKDHGLTSEIGAIISFALGVGALLPSLPLEITAALTIIVTFLLSRKNEIKRMSYSLHQFETNAFVLYGIIALVILPFLPNAWITIGDFTILRQMVTAYNGTLGTYADIQLINPYRLWLIVTFITGIDMAGYILQKTVGGQKGWMLTAISSGFLSSTSATIAFSRQSKAAQSVVKLVSAAILSNTTSFVQIALLILPVNAPFFTVAAPFLGTIVLCGITISLLTLLRRSPHLSSRAITSTTVFSLRSAVTFAVIFSVIRTASQIAKLVFGEHSIILTSAVGAVAGMDAVVISLADLAGRTISYQTALISLVLANTVNLVIKVIYAKTNGSAAFFRGFAVSIFLIIGSSIVSFIL